MTTNPGQQDQVDQCRGYPEPDNVLLAGRIGKRRTGRQRGEHDRRWSLATIMNVSG
jgi:hypothetical protein